jgi:hypothetical protein
LGLSGKAGREKASVVADRDKARGKVATKLKRLYEGGVSNRQAWTAKGDRRFRAIDFEPHEWLSLCVQSEAQAPDDPLQPTARDKD